MRRRAVLTTCFLGNDMVESPTPRGRVSFTLLEILIVLAIISALLLAIVPAVNSLSKSSGRKSAVSNLLGAIEQARAQTIKDGQPTYLVFAVFANSSAATDRYNYKSYAVFEDDPANPAQPKQLTPWRTFPTGISIRKPSLDYLTTSTFAFSPGSTSAAFPFLKFDTAGALDPSSTATTAGSAVQLTIFEGYVANGSEVITSSKDGSGNPIAVDTIAVNRITGRAERM